MDPAELLDAEPSSSIAESVLASGRPARLLQPLDRRQQAALHHGAAMMQRKPENLVLLAAPVRRGGGGDGGSGDGGSGGDGLATLLLGLRDAGAADERQAAAQLERLAARLAARGARQLRQLCADLPRALAAPAQHDGHAAAAAEPPRDGGARASAAALGGARAQRAAELDWALRFRDPCLERRFLAHQGRAMALRLDLPALLLLLLLSLLISLKEDCPPFLAFPSLSWLAANIGIFGMPLELLLVPRWTPLYLARRDDVLTIFWLCALIFMCAVRNFTDMGFVRDTRYLFLSRMPRTVHAGLNWFFTHSLLIHMRFVRKAPLLLFVAAVNAAWVVPGVCSSPSHAHLPRRICLVGAAARAGGYAALAMGLSYLIELRQRHSWWRQQRGPGARARQ